MADAVRHRGPDADGVLVDGPVGLGHRRLAIIDLRPEANQPLVDTTGRFVIVFNGEIYNFRQLKAELEGEGATFKTHSDTEVLLTAYATWGTACLRRLNGMFAFAIWDRQTQRLLLARDRLGKKPLFYYLTPGGGVTFASELKALSRDAQVPREINPAAVAHFLSLNYILGSQCIVSGVQKLAPAHYLVLERDKVSTPVCYWDLSRHFKEKQQFENESSAAEALRDLIDDSVKLRLESDVPLGAFLSGGLDSSSIVSSMCMVGTPSNTLTFSAGFEEPTYSELEWARSVARKLGVSHHEEVVSDKIEDELERIAFYCDEPFADTSVIPMYLLARFTRQHVKVALSGDGGDELFAGYETYVADKLLRIARRFPAWALAAVRQATNRLLPVTFHKVSAEYKLRQFLKGVLLTPEEAHYSWRRIFDVSEVGAVLTREFAESVSQTNPFDDFARFGRDVAGCHYLDAASYVDIKTWLADDILVKVDRATMAHSLEARAPLLDYRVVEFAASLPVGFKLKGFTKKHILKQSQLSRLAPNIVHRKKQGFNAPVSHWIVDRLRPLLEELVGNDKVRPFLDRDGVQALFDAHRGGLADNGLKLFGIMSLGMWLARS